MVTKNNNKTIHQKDLVESTEKAANMVKEGANRGKAKIENLANYAEEQAYYIGEKTREAIGKAENYAKTCTYQIEAQAKAHPFVTMGTTFLLGMLLGKILSNNK